MVFSILFSDFFFRFLLLILISIKIYFFSKNILRPYLFKEAQTERNRIAEILEKEKLLTATKNRYETQLFNQKQLFMLLEKNVHIWQQKVEHARFAEITDASRRGKIVSKRLNQSINQRAHFLWVKKRKNRFLQNIEEKVRTQFNQVEGLGYLNKLIDALDTKVD